MCGFAGFLAAAPVTEDDARIALRAMNDALRHRGPDGDGFWVDGDAGMALGHRRLSIIDLSPAGCQPMASASGRYVIVYNGELYNHRELRAELERAGAAPVWRGHSDTEVLLAAVERWGVEGALRRANAMFSFALWDRRERELTLARDRLGEKPLYYGRCGDRLLFGSELKAFAALPDFRPELDRGALTLLMRHNYVPAPHSIWRGIAKLPPAHLLVVRDGGRTIGEPQPYWQLLDIALDGARAPRADGPELVDELEVLLKSSVGLRMEADVPLGAFLSGGIDSSAVVALMQSLSPRPVKTFTIGFEESGFDEAGHAREVAAHLGTDHTELYVTSRAARDVIPELPRIWDEPFSDSSQIPTYLVSRMTRDHVTVALSGDGGDELFGGYNRYFLATRLWRMRSALPPAGRRLLARVLRSPSVATIADRATRLLPPHLRIQALGDRLPKAAEIIAADTSNALYRKLVSHWPQPADLVIGGHEPRTPLDEELGFADFRNKMMYLDTVTYLPGDILTKVDRASMAVSLEARVPFLDHRLVEFAWSLPLSAKFRGGQGKHVLRQMLYRHVPRSLIDRPKMGFGIPIEGWLSGPLREWAEELLDPRRLRDEGHFDPAPIRRAWEDHVAGRRRWHYLLWDVLMFQAWWEAQT